MRAIFPHTANMVSQSNFYTGLFLITACTLMLQVIQTRILSVVAIHPVTYLRHRCRSPRTSGRVRAESCAKSRPASEPARTVALGLRAG